MKSSPVFSKSSYKNITWLRLGESVAPSKCVSWCASKWKTVQGQMPPSIQMISEILSIFHVCGFGYLLQLPRQWSVLVNYNIMKLWIRLPHHFLMRIPTWPTPHVSYQNHRSVATWIHTGIIIQSVGCGRFSLATIIVLGSMSKSQKLSI